MNTTARGCAYTRIIESGLNADEKAILRGLLTGIDVVEVVNLGNQASDAELREIIRNNVSPIQGKQLFCFV